MLLLKTQSKPNPNFCRGTKDAFRTKGLFLFPLDLILLNTPSRRLAPILLHLISHPWHFSEPLREFEASNNVDYHNRQRVANTFIAVVVFAISIWKVVVSLDRGEFERETEKKRSEKERVIVGQKKKMKKIPIKMPKMSAAAGDEMMMICWKSWDKFGFFFST